VQGDDDGLCCAVIQKKAVCSGGLLTLYTQLNPAFQQNRSSCVKMLLLYTSTCAKPVLNCSDLLSSFLRKLSGPLNGRPFCDGDQSRKTLGPAVDE
jgi:hypothetical protein